MSVDRDVVGAAVVEEAEAEEAVLALDRKASVIARTASTGGRINSASPVTT